MESIPDIHDHSLFDWESILPNPSIDFRDFSSLPSVGRGAGSSSDLAWQVYLAWNRETQLLYVAVERVDDVYINTWTGIDPDEMWRFDSVEIVVDGDHSGGRFNDLFIGELSNQDLAFVGSSAQHYLALVESLGDRTARFVSVTGEQATGEWATQTPYFDAGGFQRGESPNVSAIEMYITPWDLYDWQGPENSRRSTLTPWKIIGLQMAVSDVDTEPGKLQGYFVLFGEPEFWSNADSFVDAQLIPCEVGCGDDDSAVKANTWARIKASFR
ncbi:MAG: hypothetical protein VX733_11940 [Candidatus Latescibacterota bacterium]|nr:hypothetical protein [Candidatus Latescibacterota bacterium]